MSSSDLPELKEITFENKLSSKNNKLFTLNNMLYLIILICIVAIYFIATSNMIDSSSKALITFVVIVVMVGSVYNIK